jgi:hypothetical protein
MKLGAAQQAHLGRPEGSMGILSGIITWPAASHDIAPYAYDQI